MARATTDRPRTLAPQPEPATLIPLATWVSHGVRIVASWRSTHVPARSSIRSHGACRVAANAAAATIAARASHAVVVMVTGCGSGGGSPVGRRWRRAFPTAVPGILAGPSPAAPRPMLSLNAPHLPKDRHPLTH